MAKTLVEKFMVVQIQQWYKGRPGAVTEETYQVITINYDSAEKAKKFKDKLDNPSWYIITNYWV